MIVFLALSRTLHGSHVTDEGIALLSNVAIESALYVYRANPVSEYY